MARTLYFDWDSGTLSGGTYTTASPEIPNSASVAFNNGATVRSEAAAPWSGQWVADCDAAWNSGVEFTCSNTTVPLQSRFLFQIPGLFNSGVSEEVLAVYNAASYLDAYLRVRKLSDGNMMVSIRWSAGAQECTLNLGSYPTNPSNIELIVDTNNATANQRFRGRVWDIGGTPGSLVNTADSSTQGNHAEFTLVQLSGEGSITTFGKVMVSDDIAEDLSSFLSTARTLTAEAGAFTVAGQAAALLAGQSLRATSDITTGSWAASGGGSLYAAIDEDVASDADYIYSPDNPTTETCEVKFGAGNDPLSSANHVVRYRLQAIGLTTTFTVKLYCGATLIATWTEASVTVAQGVTEFSHTLTGGEADAITNYSDLRLRFTAAAP